MLARDDNSITVNAGRSHWRQRRGFARRLRMSGCKAPRRKRLSGTSAAALGDAGRGGAGHPGRGCKVASAAASSVRRRWAAPVSHGSGPESSLHWRKIRWKMRSRIVLDIEFPRSAKAAPCCLGQTTSVSTRPCARLCSPRLAFRLREPTQLPLRLLCKRHGMMNRGWTLLLQAFPCFARPSNLARRHSGPLPPLC